MGEIFGHVCSVMSIMGGEPLLHPDIVRLMKIARENFTDGIIFMFTNGTLLTSMGNDFWETCCDYDIGVTISAYQIKLDTDKFMAGYTLAHSPLT